MAEQYSESQEAIKPLEYYIRGIRSGDQYVLSESITLLESKSRDHRELAMQILIECFTSKTETFRIGITGSPGVGKSTFIDSICQAFLDDGDFIGILTIDPTSETSKGSILGDKTRMDSLIRDENIFIRPSPSSSHLGGVHQHTFEAITMCEAAGYDKIWVETVGVGQSETEVAQCTDATVLLVMPGSGDSLQGIKKGIIEMADLIIVHKADGATKALAEKSIKELKEAIHFSGQNKEVLQYSSLEEKNKEQVVSSIKKLYSNREKILYNRKAQAVQWLNKHLSYYYKEIIERKIDSSPIQTIINENFMDSPYAAFNQIIKMIHLKFEIDIE